MKHPPFPRVTWLLMAALAAPVASVGCTQPSGEECPDGSAPDEDGNCPDTGGNNNGSTSSGGGGSSTSDVSSNGGSTSTGGSTSNGGSTSGSTSTGGSTSGSTSSTSSGGGDLQCRPGCVPNFDNTECIDSLTGGECVDNGTSTSSSGGIDTPYCRNGETALYNGQEIDCRSEATWGACNGPTRSGGNDQHRAACQLFCNVDEIASGLPPCDPAPSENSNCMQCHNGAGPNDPRYSGGGLEDPHPWRSAGGQALSCVSCHGGDAESGMYKDRAHVCPPPDIEQIRDNGEPRWEGVILDQYGPRAWSRYLHKSGLDKSQTDGILGIPDSWTCLGRDGSPTRTVTKTDYLQFLAPGDLRVVETGKSCGACHVNQSKAMPRSVIGTSIGLISGSRFVFGIPVAVVGRNPWAVDYGVRDITALQNPQGPSTMDFIEAGQVTSLMEPRFVQDFESNVNVQTVTVAQMAQGVESNANLDQQAWITYGYNRIRDPNSDLAKAIGVTFYKQCGDCHAGDSGQNNTTADYRGSGCAACHMEYGFEGRYRGLDPNLNRGEPINPDFIYPGERPHVREHVIRGKYRRVARQGQADQIIYGINSVRACIGCHQGSNRTVLQYVGIRLDQNQDVVNNRQFPGNPIVARFANEFQGRDGVELYNIPYGQNVNDRTTLVNNRAATQYVLYEDYGWRNIFYDINLGGTPNANDFGNRAATNRDDTPADIHYERGLECYDCHTSGELHGSGRIYARADHALAVMCESCHGNADSYAALSQNGFAVDRFGTELKHVYKDQTGRYYLIGKRDGVPHFIPQVKDLVNSNSQVTNPRNNQPLYSANADFAMGRMDFDPTNGDGPLQNVAQLDQALRARNFSHLGSPTNKGGVACQTCHTSWQNQCVGCHLDLQARPNVDAYTQISAHYANNNTGGVPNVGFPWANDINQNFVNNVNGEYVFTTQNANFTYIDITTFYIGVGSRGRIVPFTPMHQWYNYIDANGDRLQDVMVMLGVQQAATNANYTYGAVAAAKGLFSDRMGAGSSAGNRNRMTASGGYHQFMPHTQRGRPTSQSWGGFGTACFHCHLTQGTANNTSAVDLVRTTTGLGAITYKKFAADKWGCPMNFTNCAANATVNQPAGIADCTNGTALDNQARLFLFDGNANLCPPSTANNNPQNMFADYDQWVTASGVANAKNSHKMVEFGGVQRQGAIDPEAAGPLGLQTLQLLNNLNNSGIVLTQWVDWNGVRCNVNTCPNGFFQ
ncbi:MAG: multiheme c-type cytochrome [Myxococcota bacterium]